MKKDSSKFIYHYCIACSKHDADVLIDAISQTIRSCDNDRSYVKVFTSITGSVVQDCNGDVCVQVACTRTTWAKLIDLLNLRVDKYSIRHAKFQRSPSMNYVLA